MKRKLGISVYPDHSDREKDKAYIKKVADLGFTQLFMSMLEVQGGEEATTVKFKTLRVITALKSFWILIRGFLSNLEFRMII